MIAVARIARFDRRSALTTWLYRVATNAALDEGRRKARAPLRSTRRRRQRRWPHPRTGRRAPRHRRRPRRAARGVPGRGGPARPVRPRLRRDRRGARRAPGDGPIAHRPRPFGAGEGAREPRPLRSVIPPRRDRPDHDRRPSADDRDEELAALLEAPSTKSPERLVASARRRRPAPRAATPPVWSGGRPVVSSSSWASRAGQPGRGQRRHRARSRTPEAASPSDAAQRRMRPRAPRP